MDAKVYLAQFSEEFEKKANELFKKKAAEASKIDKVGVAALQNIQKYMAGGKKVRPALTSLGFRLAGGTDIKNLLPACFAVELMHNSLLIHDDFVDNDETRRGKPTMHMVYNTGAGKHYAASMAIIVADVGIFWANEIFSTLKFDPKRVLSASNYFNHNLLNTGYGELMDIYFDFQEGVTLENILDVRVYKTAYYTFVMPLTVGAALGGATKALIDSIEKFGYYVGLAFQLRDDVLGVFGDTGETGKSNESDIREGKKSILYFKALELSLNKDKEYIQKHYGKVKSKEEIERIREIIKSSGALDYSTKLAREYVQKGKEFLPKMTSDSTLLETLSTFADYMVDRTK